eukprot:TRINITY_DN24221_c0_g1_i1.p1 TRINITY_DN24221_c0_g1~~TRINITY_DN24221_c0_g1_i1.p1  ORF type:complete len:109 (+),score=41.59 TRINITY_DN24221_c0_g1_i1:85-411(+)
MIFFFSSRRRHTRCREVSWARRCVQETGTWVCRIGHPARMLSQVRDVCLDALVDSSEEAALAKQSKIELNKLLVKIVKTTDREERKSCLLYTSPSPRDLSTSRMPSSA